MARLAQRPLLVIVVLALAACTPTPVGALQPAVGAGPGDALPQPFAARRSVPWTAPPALPHS